MNNIDKGGDGTPRYDVQDFLRQSLRNSRNHRTKNSREKLMPSNETRKLLGRLLNGVGKELANQNIIGNPVDTRRTVALWKDQLGLLDQIILVVNSTVELYKPSHDNILPLLNAIHPGSHSVFQSNVSTGITRTLCNLQYAFRSMGIAIRSLQDTMDKSNSLTLSTLLPVLNQFSNSIRNFLRFLRGIGGHLSKTDIKELPQLCSYAKCIFDLLIQLTNYTGSILAILQVSSVGSLIDDNPTELIKRLHHSADLFKIHVLESLMEKRHLVFLLSELELEKTIRAKTVSTTHTVKRHPQQSGLVSYRPDFRPKGYLLPLPLARNRERLKLSRSHVTTVDCKDKITPRKHVASVRLDQLEERLDQLEQQVFTDHVTMRPSSNRVLEISTENEVTANARSSVEPPQISNLHINHWQDYPIGEMTISSALLSMLPMPSDVSHERWREVVEEAAEDLSEEISKICDEIVEEMFMSEIKTIPSPNARVK